MSYEESCACTCGGRFCASNRESLETRAKFTKKEYVNRHRPRNRDEWRALQASTKEAASRNNYPWTGAELEILARRDLTAVNIAGMTGRTFEAVKSQRRKLYREPKLQRVVGMDASGNVIN